MSVCVRESVGTHVHECIHVSVLRCSDGVMFDDRCVCVYIYFVF